MKNYHKFPLVVATAAFLLLKSASTGQAQILPNDPHVQVIYDESVGYHGVRYKMRWNSWNLIGNNLHLGPTRDDGTIATYYGVRLLVNGLPEASRVSVFDTDEQRWIEWRTSIGFLVPVDPADWHRPRPTAPKGVAVFIRLPERLAGWDLVPGTTDFSYFVAYGLSEPETDPLANTSPNFNAIGSTTLRYKTFNNIGESDPDKITVPDGTQIFRWNVVEQRFEGYEYFESFGFGWFPSVPVINPMEGYFINLP